MQDERDIRRQREFGEIRGHVGSLHVAKKMQLDRSVDAVRQGTNRAGEFAEAAARIAGLNAFDRRIGERRDPGSAA